MTNEQNAQHASSGGESQPLDIPELVQQALETLKDTNTLAASLIEDKATAGTFARHMTDGEIGALADELLQTCQEADDED